jgi:histidine ammonia-lyase
MLTKNKAQEVTSHSAINSAWPQKLIVSIQINHEEDEPELGSDEEELLHQGHFNDDMIELGNAVITAAGQGPGLFIQRRFR